MLFRVHFSPKNLHIFVFLINLHYFVVESMNILMFGGNGFIGSHVSQALLDDGHNLTLINRNNWPWDTKDTIRPKVKVVQLDRLTEKGREIFPKEFTTSNLEDHQKYYDVIIDFSAYRLSAVEPYYDPVAKICKLYVYVSTDSVYEVCLAPDKSENDKKTPIKESEAVRPADERTRQDLNARDSYGHRKLEIEEFLQRKAAKPGGIPYLILRLPDVLGERDSTDRWWKYQLWLEQYDRLKLPLIIPSFARDLTTSYVYVRDVARFLSHHVVSSSYVNFDHVINKIYNFAFEEPKLLRELLVHMKQATRSRAEIKTLDHKRGDQNGDPEPVWYFPSVTRGPLDTGQLRRDFPTFQWTQWSTMIHDVARFYRRAFFDYPKARDESARSLCRDLRLDAKSCQKFCTELLIDAEKKRKTEL